MISLNKRSVLRRQNRDRNRNIKRSVYCQYGEYGLTFRALSLRQRETGYVEKQDIYSNMHVLNRYIGYGYRLKKAPKFTCTI